MPATALRNFKAFAIALRPVFRDQDPAHLRVGYEPELAREIAIMAGGPRHLAERARYLAADGNRAWRHVAGAIKRCADRRCTRPRPGWRRADAGQLDVAVQMIEWAGRVAPDDHFVHVIRARIYADRSSIEPSLMAQNVYKVRQRSECFFLV